MLDGGRALAYLDALMNYVGSPEFKLNPETSVKLAERFEELAKKLKEYWRRGRAEA